MTFRLVFTRQAAKRIAKLDHSVRERIREALVKLVAGPDLGKRLTGLLSDRWSYRVGDWRIIYKIRRDELVVLVLTVGHRREVYE